MGYLSGYDERSDVDVPEPEGEAPTYEELLEANERLGGCLKAANTRIVQLVIRVTALEEDNQRLREALKRRSDAA